MGRSERIAAAAVAIAVISTTATQARAWCRTTTNRSFEPTSSKPCDDEGRALWWASKCLAFSVQRDASRQVSLATARAITQKAFDAWSNIGCPADPVACRGPFDRGRPSIKVTDAGPVSCDCVEYNGRVGNSNAIIFRDAAWTECDGTPKADPESTLALTTTTFNTETGEIYDADMEINTANNAITTADPPGRVIFDLQSIMAHEAGHFLGIAHTQPIHADATMFARYEQRKTFMRDLAEDDVCAICAAYPPDRAAACDTTPRRGLTLECGGGDPATESKGGCALSSEGPASAPRVVAGFFALGLGLGLARRRSRRA